MEVLVLVAEEVVVVARRRVEEVVVAVVRAEVVVFVKYKKLRYSKKGIKLCPFSICLK